MPERTFWRARISNCTIGVRCVECRSDEQRWPDVDDVHEIDSIAYVWASIASHWLYMHVMYQPAVRVDLWLFKWHSTAGMQSIQQFS